MKIKQFSFYNIFQTKRQIAGNINIYSSDEYSFDSDKMGCLDDLNNKVNDPSKCNGKGKEITMFSRVKELLQDDTKCPPGLPNNKAGILALMTPVSMGNRCKKFGEFTKVEDTTVGCKQNKGIIRQRRDECYDRIGGKVRNIVKFITEEKCRATLQ